MKLNSLLTALFVVCTTGSLIHADHDVKGRLNFLLDNALHITGYSQQDMEFAVQPSDFLGKVIVDAVSLSVDDRDAILFAINSAATTQESIKVHYAIGDMHFRAKITALKMGSAEYNYFVKVTERS